MIERQRPTVRVVLLQSHSCGTKGLRSHRAPHCDTSDAMTALPIMATRTGDIFLYAEGSGQRAT
jgi:hypothetical protein